MCPHFINKPLHHTNLQLDSYSFLSLMSIHPIEKILSLQANCNWKLPSMIAFNGTRPASGCHEDNVLTISEGSGRTMAGKKFCTFASQFITWWWWWRWRFQSAASCRTTVVIFLPLWSLEWISTLVSKTWKSNRLAPPNWIFLRTFLGNPRFWSLVLKSFGHL